VLALLLGFLRYYRIRRIIPPMDANERR